MKENNVETMLGFSKKKGMENLKIEPELHCDHFLEVWHFLFLQRFVVILV